MEQPYIQYEYMTTRKLKSILRRSLTDDSFSADDLFIIADILRQRDAGRGKDPPDAEAAWNRFVTEKLSPVSDSPSETVVKFHQKGRIYQRCAIFAICSVAIFSMLFTAQALGINIIGSVVRWTSDIFHYEFVGKDTNGFEGTRLKDFDFSDGELPGEFVPSWIPEGFQLVNSKYLPVTGVESILVSYEGKDYFFNIILARYDSAVSLDGRHFEKQASDVECYVFNNKEFVITRNGESNFLSATWAEDSLLFQVQGNISKENILKIIQSLGGTQ